MNAVRKDQIGTLISSLNAIGVGTLSSIQSKVQSAAADLEGLGEKELAALLHEAGGCLDTGDFENYRRLLSQTVSKLGHLR